MNPRNVLCFGDSNTYGYDPRSYFGGRYATDKCWTSLLSRITHWNVINAGENGRSIPVRDSIIKMASELITSYAPVDLFMVMLGSNDLLQGNDSSVVASCMESFLTKIQIERQKIILISPPPMKLGEWVSTPHLVEESHALSQKYFLVGKSLGIQTVDTSSWEIDLAFDGVHFSEAGHKSFAENLCTALNREKERESLHELQKS